MPRRSKAIIHVNRHFIAANKKDGKERPVYTCKRGSKTMYARQVEILGPSTLVQDDKALNCGARVWIETYAELILSDPMTHKEVKEKYP